MAPLRFQRPVMRVRVGSVVLLVLVVVAGVARALVLCSMFPSCCYPRDRCHLLCPSCREARFFVRGVRLFPKYSRHPCTIGGTFINLTAPSFPNAVPPQTLPYASEGIEDYSVSSRSRQ
ncbi:uncharacterized protein LOC127003147 [Eriocheir sinensis]|uniref:uncharacterized protein LOC127003147 n=1 Tax=Eriocheir sinensis TaxID=95602 RepID=UPI0021C6019C|nr:uncharacterized protein LOC127003147 [Eriocheir sinensis]